LRKYQNVLPVFAGNQSPIAEEALKMPYTAEISRANPACFLFLLDQSYSMEDKLAGERRGPSKMDVAVDSINRIINTLCQRCSSGMDVRDYFHIGALGYTERTKSREPGWKGLFNFESEYVTSLLTGTTSEQPFLPISRVVEVADIEEKRVKENYGGGEIVEVTRRMPVWLRHHNGGLDPMSEMLRSMERPLENWIGQHPNSYPPIVIIICDGWATDGDPQEEALRIRDLRTSDGNVLLFTIHLSNNDKSRPTLFPNQEEGLLSLGEGQDDSKMMFRMTSVLPEGSRRAAASLGFAVDENSRGLILNADAVALTQFLDIGTRGPSNLH
jgi:hypothetical protein